jgi:hypothetical protein
MTSVLLTEQPRACSTQWLTWHVDDVKSSHVNSEVNDDFVVWCEKKYDNDEI